MDNPMNERRLEIHEELKEEDIHYGLKEIVIDNLCKSDVNRMCFVNYPYLKRLVIHKISMNLEEFRIENCDELIDIQLRGDNEEEKNKKMPKSFIDDCFCCCLSFPIESFIIYDCKTCKLISSNIL